LYNSKDGIYAHIRALGLIARDHTMHGSDTTQRAFGGVEERYARADDG
jgi:hypothetical protein